MCHRLKLPNFILYFWVSLVFFGSYSQIEAKTSARITLPVDSVQIVYLANVNANYENCLCGEPALGGLDRIVTVISSWRAQNPRLLVFDGGDFSNAYPFAALNRLVLNIYRLIRPDLIVLGDQELQQGDTLLQKEMCSGAFPVLNSNMRWPSLPLMSKLSIRLAHHTIDVFSYLDSSAFLWAKPFANVRLNEVQFSRAFKRSLGQRRFRIVIYHGEREHLPGFLKKYPQIHLILLAHTQIRLIQQKKFPWLIGVGTDSEYLTRLSLVFSQRAQWPRMVVKSVPIVLSITPNPQARRYIQEFKSR